PEQCQVAHCQFAGQRRVFADTAGEDQAVDAWQGDSQASQRTCQTIAEHLDRQGCAGVTVGTCGNQGAHIIGQAGQSQQTAFSVEHVVDAFQVPAQCASQMGVQVGVDVTAACTHDQTFQWRHAHAG